MAEQQLHDMLVKLDRELRSGAPIAAEDRDLLERVKVDLEAVLSEARSSNPTPLSDRDVRERIDDAVQRFKASHPGLANLMAAALDALNKLGV